MLVKFAKLDDEELKAIVDIELAEAMGGEVDGELSEERSRSMDRYLGEPIGTEMEGRSQVHTRDVMEVIEWILPSLVRIFANADTSLEIEPVGPEDEPKAKQEMDYLNHLFYKKNPGFLILYTYFKDALLQKNGIVKTYAEEYEEQKRETYLGITEIEFNILMEDPDLELIEHTELQTNEPDMTAYEATGKQEFLKEHDVTFIQTDKGTRIVVDNIPPEEFLISKDARTCSPKKARFTAHRTTYTISELVEMGYNEIQIAEMERGLGLVEDSEEKISRNHLSDEQTWSEGSLANKTMQRVNVAECYMLADKNGDGVAELLKIFRSGSFIETEEIDSNPFSSITPIIMPHKFFGLSIADILEDLQELRTELLRNYMDNVYQTINGTTYYDVNKVNVDDMLTSKPYGIREVDGSPHDAILHIKPAGLPPDAFSLFELLDGLTEKRVGTIQASLDPNVLAQANTGVVLEMLNEAKAKVEMIARVFAETGVREMFRDLHELSRKHGNKDEIIKLRNEWIPVNPKEWRERSNFTVLVGLGTNNRQEKVANLNVIVDKQLAAMQSGNPIASPQNMYESSKELTELLGFKSKAQLFWTDPQTIPPPPPPPPDPQIVLLEKQAEVEQMKVEANREKVMIEDEAKRRGEELKRMELEIKSAENQAKQQIEAIKTQIQQIESKSALQGDSVKNDIAAQSAELQGHLKELEIAQKQNIADQKNELDLYKAELEAQTKIALAKPVEKDTNTNKALSGILDSIMKMQDTMDRPKEIKRDKDGKITSIGDKKVSRDPEGRPTAIG